MSRTLFTLILLGFFIAANAQQGAKPKPLQTPTTTRAKAERGQTLSGRILDEAGKPLAEVSVMAIPAGMYGKQSKVAILNMRSITTDESGRFVFEEISSGAYRLMVIALGYTVAADSLDEGGRSKYYRPGEDVQIRMAKGAVITGTVLTQSGEPLVGVRVRATRVKDAQGRLLRSAAIDEISLMKEWKTDDRGIYRIYGLEAGKYLVSAGGKGFNPVSTGEFEGEFDGDAPTYYPTGTRDTAAEISVNTGQETTGIDIHYRDNKGHIISGSISNSMAGQQIGVAMLTLANATTGSIESWTMTEMMRSSEKDGKRTFAITGIADGEYILSATSANTSLLGDASGNSSVSSPRRLKVKGSDVTGLELTLVPLGSIAGRVFIEQAKSEEGKTACQSARKISMEEVVLLARSDSKNKERTNLMLPSTLSSFAATAESVLDEKGEFKIFTMDSSRYRLEVKLPTQDWYVRSIQAPKTESPAKEKNAKAQAKDDAAKQSKDLARNGINVKLGEKVENILITVAEGAAGLRGQIKIEKDGDALPPNLRIFLLPAETEGADDVLRFFEADAQKDGAFAISNIPPGRYFILTRMVAEDASEENPRPTAWDADLRQLLHTEAEAKNQLIELQPCQRLSDFVLRYSAPTPSKRPEQKKAQQ